ncbi:hypothetical protein BsWGS_17424 [Bradybaena similaris]
MAASRRYLELYNKKLEIESTIKELTDLLNSQKGVGLTESLVDAEGFPRSDIDVYSCRHARHQISCLQNDHITVMKQIEEELVNIHQEARGKHGNHELSDHNMTDAHNEASIKVPFAVVDRVDFGSPAANGGFEVGDELVEFGSVTFDNFVNLQSVGAVLQHSKDRPISVVVLRKGRLVRLTVVPTTWSGPGLLGCNIKPLRK